MARTQASQKLSGVQVLGILFLGGIGLFVAASSGAITIPGLSPDVEGMQSKVHPGMSYDEVETAIGKPQDTQEMNGSQQIAGSTITTDMQMWYYGGHKLQVVFDHGKVTGVNRY